MEASDTQLEETRLGPPYSLCHSDMHMANGMHPSSSPKGNTRALLTTPRSHDRRLGKLSGARRRSGPQAH